MKIGPKFKIAKRLGSSVFEKCQTQKFALSESRTGRTSKRRTSRSDYGRQFLEKQKVRFTYSIPEKQFKNYIIEANSTGHNPAELLFQLLERRLDNVAYRMGLFKTRRGSRQGVSHGHVTVNGRRVTIPSYRVKEGDKIAIRAGSRNAGVFRDLEERLKDHISHSWVIYDLGKNDGQVKSLPKYNKTENAFDLSPVLEFYSR